MKAFRLLLSASAFVTAIVAACPSLHAQSLVQVNSAGAASASQLSVLYTQSQVSGDLNIVVVGWRDTIAVPTSVTDTKGNVYTLALGPTTLSGQLSQSIYLAKNIIAATAGSNTVTVAFNSGATAPEVRILEYGGVDANNPLDGAVGGSGNTATTDSGAANTTYANDLLIGASLVSTSTTAPGAGYTTRIITTNGNLVEDELVSATGSYHATSTLSSAGAWIMQIVALRAAGAPPAPSAPGSLTAVASSTSEIDLSWIGATGGTISSYLIERCLGVSCSNFVQIGTTTSTTFSDTGLAAGTSYTYRVRAEDSANNLGPYSNAATTATLGSPSPTAPGNLSAVAGTLAPVVVSEQGYIDTTYTTTHTTAAFDSTGGDLLVLFASSHAGTAFTPTDSYGNTWISVAGPTSTTTGFDLRSQMWYARNPLVGPSHTVTMGLSVAQPLVMSILVVKGSNIAAPIDAASAIGSDNGTQSVNIASPIIATTTSNELLLGFAKVSAGSVFQPGTGFTQQTAASSNYLDAEAGLASTAGSYSATFTVGAPVTWQAAAMAVIPAVASNPNQVNLTWTASTETGGTISSYLVERYQGVSCNSFTQIGTSATTAYSDSGVSASTSYSYRVRAKDTSGTVGPYSNTATITTPAAIPAPSITTLSPASGAVGTAVTITGANFGATQGTSTVSFNGTTAVPTSWSATSIVAPVPTGATTGNVTVTVGGQVSNGVAFTVTTGSPSPTAPGNLSAVAGTLAPVVVSEQGYIDTTFTTTHTTAAFDSTGGDLLVLFASSHAGTAFTPTDSYGNTWISVAGPTSTTTGFDLRSQMWYARNPLVGPSHTVTMGLSVAQPLVMSILVVKGSNIAAPIDAASAIGSDNGTQSVNIASPIIATTTSNELLLGFAKVSAGSVFQPGTGFTQQTAASSNYLDAEAGLASTAGSYSATFTVGAPVTWQAAAMAVIPAVASNPNQVNLTWTASTETGGTISSYLVERCQGVSCNSFTQIGTSATTAYSDSGVSASTSYSYRVRAKDTSGTVGPYSNTATITTPAAIPAPSITTLSPASGAVGTAVTITGANFGATQGTSTVSFNGTTAVPTSWSATSIVAPVPTGATTGNVTVTVGGQVSNGMAFTVTIPAPSISSLSPGSGPVGTAVTITGANFGATQGSSTVSFNGTLAVPTSWSSTGIVVPVPTGATTGNVTVTVGGQVSNGVVFTIAAAPPPGSITHLQQGSSSDVSGKTYTSFSATFPAGTASGSAIVIGVTYGNANPTITASDSQGNLYTRAVASYDSGHSQGCAILYATGSKGGSSNTVTVNFSSAVAYLAMGIHEYSGVAAASALDTSAGTRGSGTSPSSGSWTTTANGDLIFGCVAEDSTGSGDTFTAGSGFTKRVDLGLTAAYSDEDGVQRSE